MYEIISKWVLPYQLRMFSHKLEHPKSTPYHSSCPLILVWVTWTIIAPSGPGTNPMPEKGREGWLFTRDGLRLHHKIPVSHHLHVLFSVLEVVKLPSKQKDTCIFHQTKPLSKETRIMKPYIVSSNRFLCAETSLSRWHATVCDQKATGQTSDQVCAIMRRVAPRKSSESHTRPLHPHTGSLVPRADSYPILE